MVISYDYTKVVKKNVRISNKGRNIAYFSIAGLIVILAITLGWGGFVVGVWFGLLGLVDYIMFYDDKKKP